MKKHVSFPAWCDAVNKNTKSATIFFQNFNKYLRELFMLNDNQKRRLVDVLQNVYFYQFDDLKPKIQLAAYQAILAEIISADSKKILDDDIRGTVEDVRAIMSHPCPQNRRAGDKGVLGEALDDKFSHSDLGNGIKDGIVYFWKGGAAGTGVAT